jgi:hypothetical protein
MDRQTEDKKMMKAVRIRASAVNPADWKFRPATSAGKSRSRSYDGKRTRSEKEKS